MSKINCYYLGQHLIAKEKDTRTYVVTKKNQEFSDNAESKAEKEGGNGIGATPQVKVGA